MAVCLRRLPIVTPRPTDTRGQTAYGVPIRIFTKDDITQAIASARRYGLEITSPFDPTCRDRLVTWDPYGVSYTFAVIAMTRTR